MVERCLTMATVLAVRTPLSQRQLTFLRDHIIHQKKKAEANNIPKEGQDGDKEPDSKPKRSSEGDEGDMPDIDSKQETSDQQAEVAAKEPETESPDDIASQIEVHQKRLESLREEKHRLFQQLKMVLHEEDEKKRLKEEEQKQELKSLGGMVSHLDPRLSQSTVGIKRALPLSPPVPHQEPPVKKTHRAPLLPTPESVGSTSSSGSTTPYIRQGSGGTFRHHPGEGYHGASRQHYPPGTHVPVGQRAPFPDQRFGPGPPDSRVIAHPQTNLQGGIVQHHAQVYSGTQTLSYQYTASAPYGNMSGVQPPTSQTSQLHYQQQMPRFVHPHEVPMQGQFIPSYGQPHPHDVHLAPIQQPHDIAALQGHPHFVTQGGQMLASTGFGEHSNNLPPGVSYAGHIQDPRHQKVLDHHRPASLQSPTQLTKQESYSSSVLGSPSSPVPSSRDRKSKKEL